MSEMEDFSRLFGALTGNRSIFPAEDARDLDRGARYIPDQVTDSRRDGKPVTFVTDGEPSEWYWEMPDGSHIPHD